MENFIFYAVYHNLFVYEGSFHKNYKSSENKINFHSPHKKQMNKTFSKNHSVA